VEISNLWYSVSVYNYIVLSWPGDYPSSRWTTCHLIKKYLQSVCWLWSKILIDI